MEEDSTPRQTPGYGDGWQADYYWPDELPDLASLVAEAERGLSEAQRPLYAREIVCLVFPDTRKADELTPYAQLFRLITAAPEARAAALLQILP